MSDLSKVETVARATWPVAYAGLTEFEAEGLKHLTVEVERDNHQGRRFYEGGGFTEPRALTREVQGHVLPLVEYRRPILGSGPDGA